MAGPAGRPGRGDHPPGTDPRAPGARAQRNRRSGRSSSAGLRGFGPPGMAGAGRPPGDPARTLFVSSARCPVPGPAQDMPDPRAAPGVPGPDSGPAGGYAQSAGNKGCRARPLGRQRRQRKDRRVRKRERKKGREGEKSPAPAPPLGLLPPPPVRPPAPARPRPALAPPSRATWGRCRRPTALGRSWGRELVAPPDGRLAAHRAEGALWR